MIDQVGSLYPVVICSGRVPRSIVSAPLLQIASVRHIYTSDPAKLNQAVVERLGIPLDPISRLPPEVRLEKAGNQAIRDPAQAVCTQRHREPALPIWRRHLQAGNLALLVECDLCGDLWYSLRKGLLGIFGWDLLFDTNSPLWQKNSQLLQSLIQNKYRNEAVRGIFY